MAAKSRFSISCARCTKWDSIRTRAKYESHPNLTNRVNLALQRIRNLHGSNLTPEIAYQEIVELTNRIKNLILANLNTKIDDLIF
jgi:hypothetical protein